jgi:nitrite reductase/ring-hydroxylating ferredoxin subunit
MGLLSPPAICDPAESGRTRLREMRKTCDRRKFHLILYLLQQSATTILAAAIRTVQIAKNTPKSLAIAAPNPDRRVQTRNIRQLTVAGMRHRPLQRLDVLPKMTRYLQVQGSNPGESVRMPFVKVGDVSELARAGQFSRWVGNHDILVFRRDGEIRAFTNVCPHFGGPVGFHKMKDGKFTCLWHNLEFSAQTGECLSGPRLKLREYNIKLDGDAIYAELAEEQDQ